MSSSIVILAGGQSRRFGTDKARHRLGEQTLLERVAASARGTGMPVRVVGRTVPRDWPWPDVSFHPDEKPGQGPLGGLITGLHVAEGPMLAVACDMPRISPEALEWLSVEARETDPDHGLITYQKGGGLQPLFAVYTPASLPLMERLMERGMRSLHTLVSAGRFQLTRIPDRFTEAVRGINTPEEARELALEWDLLEGPHRP